MGRADRTRHARTGAGPWHRVDLHQWPAPAVPPLRGTAHPYLCMNQPAGNAMEK